MVAFSAPMWVGVSVESFRIGTKGIDSLEIGFDSVEHFGLVSLRESADFRLFVS